jgi:uncharacterized membrane protein YphA (DoxX/SURF4 family)
MNLSHLPLRLAIGAFFVNSGLSKRSLEGEAAAGVHGMAANAIPAIKRIQPNRFGQLLSTGEILIGTALLLPVVPSAVAGAALVGFGSGLMRLYWATPGLHPPNDPRPTEQGIAIAKDSWLVGAGLTLLLDDLLGRLPAVMKRR